MSLKWKAWLFKCLHILNILCNIVKIGTDFYATCLCSPIYIFLCTVFVTLPRLGQISYHFDDSRTLQYTQILICYMYMINFFWLIPHRFFHNSIDDQNSTSSLRLETFHIIPLRYVKHTLTCRSIFNCDYISSSSSSLGFLQFGEITAVGEGVGYNTCTKNWWLSIQRHPIVAVECLIWRAGKNINSQFLICK